MGEQVNTGFELSPQQKSVWFAQQGRTYCSQCVLVLETAVDGKKLRSALGAVIARHEILRTTFPARPGVKLPFQLIHESLAAEWRAQGEFIAPATMPVTRLANSIIDGVADAPAPVDR